MANESTETSRAIAIAYDNSGSMIQNSDKWCEAKYSLEVLAAMLNSQDTMALYGMDDTALKFEINGTESTNQRVAAIHNADLGVSDWTDTEATQLAISYLGSSSANEKYLIITSDGAFNKNGDLNTVQSMAQQAASQGITVIYLAIGSDAETITSNPDGNIYVKLASSSTILPTMTEVANQIFGRDSLDTSALNTANNTLTLDVPMQQIIVFAQGKDVNVGTIKSQSGSSSATPTLASVRYSDSPSANTKYNPYEVDYNLQGVVATYDSKLEKGTYSIDISGAESVEVYYVPYVNISVELTDNNGISYTLTPDGDNNISAGTYNVSYSFQDPNTGEELTSDLLYPATFNLKAEADGNVQSVGQNEQITISQGTVNFIATAQTTGGAKATQSYRGVNVSAAVTPLDVDASQVTGSINLPDFNKTALPVTITKQDGTAITDSEWASLTLTVKDEQNITWTYQKSETPGTLSITPTYTDDNLWTTHKAIFGTLGTSPKTSTVALTAEIPGTDLVYRGQATAQVSYVPSLATTLSHIWPFIVLALLALYLLYKYATKPRLPRKMKPHIDFDNVNVRLKYSEGNITNRLSPWGPERVKISITPRDPKDASTYKFSSRFKLSSVGLVAAKKERGKRRFTLDESTAAAMRSHMENPGNFPDPQYAPMPPAEKKGGRRLGGLKKKARKGATKGAGSSITFTGNGQKVPGKKVKTVEYTLKFK